ncbi:hypothetical protein BKP45_20245 [Anaerobacillus alkalidiazotrophicus]|uniref:Uncharacterized protein n=1 Tax=Anaerobacillus alkalidiazotrophicus TaxID=472963 RepID=A0A1S2M068_9BACI|nr:YlzJ-like family protein [Anaerobacillus alkalidiazotrophicus]OIJ17893.1 hypothetical protein BKP45_20245 [Anaerobacillus alkalidiazotrophicus]
MILYTTMPEEFIFPHQDEVFSKQITIEIKEGQLIVEQVSNHEFRIVRLLSTDPMAFLNENYSPGKMIALY